MKTLLFSLHLALLQISLAGGEPAIAFADANTGRKLLSTPDEFTRALSPFDRQARMRAAEPPSPEAFLTFLGEAAIDWPADERRRLEASFQRVVEKLNELGAPLPDGAINLIRDRRQGEPQVGRRIHARQQHRLPPGLRGG